MTAVIYGWRGWPIRIAALLLACAPLSCGDPPPSATLHVDDLPELSHVEELRIGSVDDPVAGFSQIRSVRVSESGDVYVLDGASREVRIFSSDGTWLGSVGGEGEGPGEFLAPTGMGLLGDTLWVIDARARRITWFGPERNVILTTPAHGVPIESGQPGLSLTVTPRYPRPDGFIESGLTRMVTPGREIQPYTYPVLRFDREGEVADTLRWESADESVPTYRVAGRDAYAPYLPPLRPIEEDLDDGRVVVDWSAGEGAAEGSLSILRLRSEADTVFRRELRYEPVPVPEGVLDSLISPQLAIAPALGVTEGEMERSLRAAVEVPDFRPPVRRVLGGTDGTLWIELNTASTDTATWVLIDDGGTVRGTVGLPIRMRIHHSDLPVVWAVDRDELDVPWLVRLSVGSNQ